MAVLATQGSLECGFARDLFVEWAPEARNCVIITDRPQPGSLAETLLSTKPSLLTLKVIPATPH
jgi:cleavage and polyadenylation specificity factor subunit 2